MIRSILYSSGGRKLLFGLLVFIAGVVYFERDKLTAAQWIDLTKWTAGFVTAAIAVEGAAEKIAEGRRRE